MDTPEQVNGLKPKRVALFFTAVDNDIDVDLDQCIAQVADDGEMRGLFFEWAAIGEMDINDVIQGSPLHQALLGKPPDK